MSLYRLCTAATLAVALSGAISAPVWAQESSTDIATLIKSVSSVSNGLNDTISTFGARMEASANSAAEGTKLLDEMIAAAKEVHENLDKDSEIWTDLNSLMAEWGEKRDDLMKRAAVNAALKPVADTWQDRIDKAMVLRDQIREQSTDGVVLIEQLESQREVVLALYEAEMADQVLATMQQISSELTEMNEAMGAIVNQAEAVGGEAVASD